MSQVFAASVVASHLFSGCVDWQRSCGLTCGLRCIRSEVPEEMCKVRRPLWIMALLFGAIIAPCARATTITLVTPLGSTTSGGAVDASAAFTTGTGTVTINLTNLEANPPSISQLIIGLDFPPSTGPTTRPFSSNSGQQLTVDEG